MLKMSFFLLFLLPVCFMSYIYWMVQVVLFLMSFIFLLMNMFWIIELLSYGMILLNLWIWF